MDTIALFFSLSIPTPIPLNHNSIRYLYCTKLIQYLMSNLLKQQQRKCHQYLAQVEFLINVIYNAVIGNENIIDIRQNEYESKFVFSICFPVIVV